LCIAAFCFAGSQAGRYAEPTLDHGFHIPAPVHHNLLGDDGDLDHVEDLPEVDADKDGLSDSKNSHQTKYDDQFDEIIEDHSHGHDYAHNDDAHNSGFGGRLSSIVIPAIQQKYGPVMHALHAPGPIMHALQAPNPSHGYGYVHAAPRHAPALYTHETYGRNFDVKSDFYNDHSNAFNQKHVPAMLAPKVYQAAKVDSHAAHAAGLNLHGNRMGYAAPAAHGDYKFSGRYSPVTAGHYVGYGNKYGFRHGYPYGYGEMLDYTPAGYSLHSGSRKLVTKPDYNLRHASDVYGHGTYGHGGHGYGLNDYGYDLNVHSPRQGYAANNYKFSGRYSPVTAGHYVGYGNKYGFTHGYPYGYGEMLAYTPAGYSLHSGSRKLVTKPDYNLRHASDFYGHDTYGHDSHGYDLNVYSPRQGYAANNYKFSGRYSPVTAGHYVGYGNKYGFRHGYPYGYGEMLEYTPAGYSLRSGSRKLVTQRPAFYHHNHNQY